MPTSIRCLVKIVSVSIGVLLLGAFWTGRDYIFIHSKTAYKIESMNRSTSHNGPIETVSRTVVPGRMQGRTVARNTTSSDSESRRCTLTWNASKINSTVYETDTLKMGKPEASNQGYAPVLLQQDPDIKLSRSAYLLPDLMWGPNNQLIGLMESIFVTIKLNRTLVLPFFHKHKTDKQFRRGSKNRISPLHRVDLLIMCKFVSCVTIDEFQRACNFQIDGVINKSRMNAKYFADLESKIGMRINRRGTEFFIPKNGTTSTGKKLNFTESEIPNLFTSSAKCVIYPLPFWDVMTIDIAGRRETLYDRLNSDALQAVNVPTDLQLAADIFRHIPKPSYIRQIAIDFVSSMTSESTFISAHWRYNEGDSLNSARCSRGEIFRKVCMAARNFKSPDFAKKLIAKSAELYARNVIVGSVYIAAVRSELPFVQAVSADLSVLEGSLRVFHAEHLENFMKIRYNDCGFIAPHFEDILSSVEMEICAMGVSFLGSRKSTWSGNVFKARMQLERTKYDISPDYLFDI